MKKIFFLMLTLLIMSATSMNAQVTIGADKDPESFSVLELIGSGTRGLRLPQVNATQRSTLTKQLTLLGDDKKEEAMGLMIFNTTSNCTETWNGSSWISACAGPIASAQIAGPISGRTGYYMFSYQTITLTATGSGGSTPTAYQWYRNNVLVSGATNSTYVFAPAETANERENYTFYCLISNNYSTIKSNELSVIVEKATLGVLKGIPLRKDGGTVLTVAAQYLGQESSTDGGYTGDLYQYGRMADGHEKQNSPETTIQATNSTDPYEPAEVSGKFINHAPWSSVSDFTTLWTTGLATREPCPAGWHLPTEAEWRSVFPKVSNNPTGSQHLTLTFDEPKACFFLTDGQNQLTIDLNVMRHQDGVAFSVPGYNGECFSRLLSTGFTFLQFMRSGSTTNIGTYSDLLSFRGYRVRCVK
jgi:uncharacterized protein (TIGR02145 family)